MAESVIGITEGSGKFGHTFQRVIGANTVEDGVVLLGEQYLASYRALNSGTGVGPSTATANSHLGQLMAGATLKVRVRRIELHQQVLATTAALMQLFIIRLTTAGTGGGSELIVPLDTTDAAAGATYMSLPTVKGTEGSIIDVAQPYMAQTLATGTATPSPMLVWDFDKPRQKPLIIPAGVANGICIKNVSAIAAGRVWINIWLDESNF